MGALSYNNTTKKMNYTLTPPQGLVSKTDLFSKLEVWKDKKTDEPDFEAEYGDALFKLGSSFAKSQGRGLRVYDMNKFETTMCSLTGYGSEIAMYSTYTTFELALGMRSRRSTFYKGELCTMDMPATLADFHNALYFSVNNAHQLVLFDSELAAKSFLEERIDVTKFCTWLGNTWLKAQTYVTKEH